MVAWALVLVAIGALGAHGDDFARLDVWAWTALVAFAAAPLIGVTEWPSLRWMLASLPFWVFGDASDAVRLTAFVLFMVGLIRLAVGPTLVARGRTSAEVWPPILPSGSSPLVRVAPRVYPGAHPSRGLHWVALILVMLGLVLVVVAGTTSDSAAAGALALAAWIMAGTFFFGNWFATRVRLRVDEVGLHGRVMFFERSAPWNEITTLSLRYVFLGAGGRFVYYVVRTAHCEVAFPSGMTDASDLLRTIESATGETFPTPEIAPTM